MATKARGGMMAMNGVHLSPRYRAYREARSQERRAARIALENAVRDGLKPGVTVLALAARLKVSKGVVSGIINRLGIKNPNSTDEHKRRGALQKQNVKARCEEKPKACSALAMPAPASPSLSAQAQRVKAEGAGDERRRQMLAQLSRIPGGGFSSCQFIPQDPRIDPAKCGAPCVAGSAYCEPHLILCHRGGDEGGAA